MILVVLSNKAKSSHELFPRRGGRAFLQSNDRILAILGPLPSVHPSSFKHHLASAGHTSHSRAAGNFEARQMIMVPVVRSAATAHIKLCGRVTARRCWQSANWRVNWYGAIVCKCMFSIFLIFDINFYINRMREISKCFPITVHK